MPEVRDELIWHSGDGDVGNFWKTAPICQTCGREYTEDEFKQINYDERCWDCDGTEFFRFIRYGPAPVDPDGSGNLATDSNGPFDEPLQNP